jgi:hypothetical protein
MGSSADASTDFIRGMSDRNRHILAGLILFLIPLFLYTATIIGDKQFMGHDTIMWRAGAESVIEARDHMDQEPLWSTNMFSGMPAYVISYVKSVPNLDTLLFDLGKSFYPAMRCWILLMGAYLFFVIQGIRSFTSAMGAILFGFTTYIPIIIGAGHNTKFTAMVFIPWMFLGYWMMSRSDKRWLSLFVFAFALIMELRAGHPQVTYYFFYLLGIWWLVDTVQAYREDRLTPWLQRTGWMAAAGVLALIANLQPYWSIYEYSPYSIRGGSASTAGSNGLNLEYAFAWSQGWGELLTLIMPALYGGASGEGTYWGPKSVTSGPHYFSGAAIILVILGILLYKRREKYIFLGTGILTMLFSLGYHFRLLNEVMFKYVPYFNKFRTPEMWLIVTVFCMAVLAVYGMDALLDALESQLSPQQRKQSLIAIAAVVGLAFILAFGTPALFSFEKPGEVQRIAQQAARQNNVSPDNSQLRRQVRNYINQRIKPDRKAKAESDAKRFLLLTVLVGAVLIAAMYRKIPAGYVPILILLIVAYDLVSVDQRYYAESSLVPDHITREQAVQRQGRQVDRYLQDLVGKDQSYSWRVFPMASNPFNNSVPAYFYPSIGGYSGAKLSRYQEVVDNLLFAGPELINEDVMNMLNVKYLIARQPLPEPYQPVQQAEGFTVFENPNVLPKAFFVDQVTAVDSPSEALRMLQQTDSFDPSQMAVAEREESLQLTSDSTASVSVTEYGPREIRLNYSRNSEGYLVLSETYYPAGWHASIDGNTVPIEAANYILRGMKVPAGDHEVTLRFDPASHIWGSRVAWFGNIMVWLLGLGVVAMAWRERNASDPS